jgi:ELWxxDGT repeat protein
MLFFSASDGEHGRELWRSDGTESGTTMVKDIWPGPDDADPRGLVAFGSELYFFADDGKPREGKGESLWRSDGTEAGTVIVKRFHARDGYGCSYDLRERSIADIDGTLFFDAADGKAGCEPWTSDGTALGTRMILDIARRGEFPGSYPYGFTAVGSVVYFIADDQRSLGRALWRTDGTAAGTHLVKDPQGGMDPCCTVGNRMVLYTGYRGDLYFESKGAGLGQELWKSDGTAAGTTIVKDLNPGRKSSYPGWVVMFHGKLYFSALSPRSGGELWMSDGTERGTQLVRSSWPGELTRWGRSLYFSASDGDSGWELWHSDGSRSGTAMVADIRDGPKGSSPSQLVHAIDTLYFAAEDETHGDELWRSDGRDSGTTLVFDLVPGPEGSSLEDLVPAGDLLFLTADDLAHGRELWVSDGSQTGTVMVTDLIAGPGSSEPRYVVFVPEA